MPRHRIQQLHPADIQLLRSLLKLFGDAFEEPQTYISNQPGDSYLEKLLAQDSFIALVASCENEVVGGLTAYELPKFEQERSEIYIYDLAVSAVHRRNGVATALIEKLKALAAERGAWIIFVQADYGDDPAIALYTRLGSREDVLHFDINISK